jgi:hypothetical protein
MTKKNKRAPEVSTKAAAGMVDAVIFVARIIEMKSCAAFVECVGSISRQGVSSTFHFGKASGIVIGALAALGISHTLVAPGAPKALTFALPLHAFVEGRRRGAFAFDRSRGVIEGFFAARHISTSFISPPTLSGTASCA